MGLDLYKTFELFFLTVTYALILYNVYKVRIYVISMIIDHM